MCAPGGGNPGGGCVAGGAAETVCGIGPAEESGGTPCGGCANAGGGLFICGAPKNNIFLNTVNKKNS